MKRVLLISYVFPPMAAVGGYRTIKYCKFLPEFGWRPTVLTVRSGYNVAYDPSLLQQIDRAVTVYRSGNWEPLDWWDKHSQAKPSPPSGSVAMPSSSPAAPSLAARTKSYIRRWLSLPDSNNFWIPFGVITGLKAVRREQIDIIYSTSPPASAHVVGYLLSLLTGKPLVIDFRDLWTQNESYDMKGLSPFQRRLDRWLERRVINRARGVITTTRSFSTLTQANNPNKDAGRVHTITNGIDADDFRHVTMPETKNDRFTVLHLGSLYGHRNPAFFFEAAAEWAKRRPEIVGRVQIDFIGNAPGFEAMVQREPLKNLVNMLTHIPHDKVLDRLWQADILLLILGFDPGGRGVLPAKLFEYLCTARPILAIVPRGGEAQAVLEDYANGLTVNGPDLEATVSYLDLHYDRWQASGPHRDSKISIPPQYDRRLQAQRLAAVLDSV
jgi:glycosyltransferase involved in cell wall biosynthesis